MEDGQSAEGEEEEQAEPEPEHYNAVADEKDAKHAAERRGAGPSDAELSCPSCFTRLCVESQQHSLYATQFRALDAFNVKIKHAVQLTVDNDVYNPVCCVACDYECAVFDSDQVYHFHDVIARDV